MSAVKGHKCKGVLFGALVKCECGWDSGTWYGKGARSNAYTEWRRHVERCDQARSREQESALAARGA